MRASWTSIVTLLTLLLEAPPTTLHSQSAQLSPPREQSTQLHAHAEAWGRAQALLDQGHLAAASTAGEEALAIQRQILGSIHEDVAITLDWLANVYVSQEVFTAAALYFSELVAVRTALHGRGDWRVTNAQLALETTRRLARMSREDRQRLRRVAQLTAQTVALHERLELPQAVANSSEALVVYRQLLGDTHPYIATGLDTLATLFVEQGDAHRAEPLFQQALAIRRNVLGEMHPDTATSLDNLARCFAAQGGYVHAEPLLQQALTIRRKILGDLHPDATLSLHHLADLYIKNGDYAHSESLYHEAVTIRRKVFGEMHPDTATSLDGLARVHQEQGDYSRAEPLYQQALAIRRKVLGEMHPNTAISLNNLATLYQQLGNQARAAPLHQQALAIHRKVLGEMHPLTATSLDNLASVHAEQRDYARAEPLYQEALTVRRKVLGDMHPDTASSLSNLASLYVQQGDYTRAELLYQQAHVVFRQVLGDMHPDTATSLKKLAALYRGQGDDARAESLYLQALRIRRRNLELSSVAQSERQQLAHAASLRSTLDEYLALGVDSAAVRVSTAWEQVVAWKGAILARRRAERAVAYQPETKEMLTDLQRSAAQLASLAIQAPAPSEAEAWRRRLIELSTEKEQREAALMRISAAYRAATQPMTASALQRALRADIVLLDFLEYRHYAPRVPAERRLIAFVVARDTPIEIISLGPVAPIEGAISAWRAGQGSGAISIEAGRALRAALWAPLERRLERLRPTQVLVSPDGGLSHLPFGALPGRRPGTYLIEDWPIATIPAPLLLTAVSAPDAHTRPVDSLLVLGDINYDRREGADIVHAGSSRAAVRDAGTRFPPLAGTQDELVAIEKLYRTARGESTLTTLDGARATEHAIRQQAPQHRYLHLATHGFFAPARFRSAADPTQRDRNLPFLSDQTVGGYHPGLLSGLALAGANTPTAVEDGILTAEEVATLDLTRVELAVLSACETGLGPVAGGEGLLSLQRAFQAAGARSVIASLWKVDDLATRDLMQRFYDNLWNKKLGTLAALREAQLWMLQTGGSRGLPHALATMGETSVDPRLPPRYWAAFVLSGDGH